MSAIDGVSEIFDASQWDDVPGFEDLTETEWALLRALVRSRRLVGLSVADFVLLRPLPVPDPDTLVRVCEGPRTGGGWGCMNQLSPANYRDLKTMSASLQAMGAFNKPESSAPYQHLINRIEAVSNDKRYEFMFSRLTVQDNMGQVLSRILRIPVAGKPITIIDLSGVPSETRTTPSSCNTSQPLIS